MTFPVVEQENVDRRIDAVVGFLRSQNEHPNRSLEKLSERTRAAVIEGRLLLNERHCHNIATSTSRHKVDFVLLSYPSVSCIEINVCPPDIENVSRKSPEF